MKDVEKSNAPQPLGFGWWSFLLGAIGGAGFGAIAGLTGFIQMEYRGAKPWEHAIMLAMNFGAMGMVLGLAVGLVVWFIRLFTAAKPD